MCQENNILLYFKPFVSADFVAKNITTGSVNPVLDVWIVSAFFLKASFIRLR